MSGPAAVALAPLLLLALWGLFWLYRDGKSRDIHPWLWVGAALAVGVFVHPVALLLVLGIYFLFRPKGALRACPHCGRGVLARETATCPWCRRAVLKDCPRCREAVFVAEPACPRCGARL